MADTHTREQRSKNMAAIKSKGNKTTELLVKKIFEETNIKDWRRHVKQLPGKPDFVFREQKLVVFVDGCFWHGCKKCNLRTQSNKEYWESKISGNVARDRRQARELKKNGWTVIRFWEHQVKKAPEKIAGQISQLL